MFDPGDLGMEKCSCYCSFEEKCSIIDLRANECCPRCKYLDANSQCTRLVTFDPYLMVKDLRRYRKTDRIRCSEMDFLDAF